MTDEALRAVTIKQINALANNLGWDDKKRKRLDVALNKLAPAFDRSVTQDQIKQTSQTIIIRGREIESLRGVEFLRLPVQVDKPVSKTVLFLLWPMPLDCLTEWLLRGLLNSSAWVIGAALRIVRIPQEAIEKKGLTGGEVILLAESFGQAEVIPRSAFEKTLNEGRPIMVNVVSPDGNWNRGHEVVLTKTFQYQNDTWFEIMDSNLGPQRRLYLTRKELDIIIQENGVAFCPEPGTTPRLLR